MARMRILLARRVFSERGYENVPSVLSAYYVYFTVLSVPGTQNRADEFGGRRLVQIRKYAVKAT